MSAAAAAWARRQQGWAACAGGGSLDVRADEGVHVKGPAQASVLRAASPASSEATISVGRDCLHQQPAALLAAAYAVGPESNGTLSAFPAGGRPPWADPHLRGLPCEPAAQGGAARASAETWR